MLIDHTPISIRFERKPVTIRFQFMVINLKVCKLSVLQSQMHKYNSIKYRNWHLQLTEEVECFWIKIQRISLWYHHCDDSFYLIAYMNTNEWDENNGDVVVPLFRFRSIIIAFNLDTIRFTINREEKNSSTVRRNSTKFTFPFWKLRKSELFYLQLFFRRWVLPRWKRSCVESKKKKWCRKYIRKKELLFYSSLWRMRVKIGAARTDRMFPL